MIVFFLVTTLVIIAFTFLLYFKFSTNTNELKNDFKALLPAILSNIEDVLFSWNDNISLFKQSSKVVVLTCANCGGISLHVLKKLLTCEMTVILGVRNPEESKKIIEQKLDESITKGKIFYKKCDTGNMQSVREFAFKVEKQVSAVHLLINNAEILCPPYQKTSDGFESQMAVNYLGHFLLTHLLWPLLLAGSENNDGNNSRVVNVSSCANECGSLNYDDFKYDKYFHTGLAYGDSKLAQIVSMKYLEKICKQNGWNVQSHAAYSGIVDNEISNNSVWGSLKWLRRLLFKTPERGSRTIVYTAISSDIEGVGGTYLNNCRESGVNDIANDEKECKKFFDYTCNLLKIENFGRN